MKAVKLTKKMLRMHPADLLLELGAVNMPKTQAYPSCVYMSKADYKELRQNLVKSAKKQYPYATKNRLDSSVNMELLNYGPSESLQDAIKPGYVLLDVDSINTQCRDSEE